MKYILHPIYFLALLSFVWIGCFDGAPHSHPLDPRGGEFINTGQLTGAVTGFYAPFIPLEGVEIRLSPGVYQGLSDENGRFSLEQVPPGRYEYTAYREGYSIVSDSIDIVLNESLEIDIRLGGLPVVEAVALKTFHLARFWPPPVNKFWIDVEVEVSDLDGIADIDEVLLDIPLLDATYPLSATGVPQQFSVRLREQDLGTTVASIIGHDMGIRIRDRAGFEGAPVIGQIARVIEDSPIVTEPIELAVISDGLPLYRWNRAILPFPFTYQLNVWRVDTNVQTRVLTISDVPSDTLQFQATETLPRGDYTWSVSIVDEFGNKSRSREASFRIP